MTAQDKQKSLPSLSVTEAHPKPMLKEARSLSEELDAARKWLAESKRYVVDPEAIDAFIQHVLEAHPQHAKGSGEKEAPSEVVDSPRQKNLALPASLYAQLVPRLREVAATLGYALTVHGSMTRDCDLVAVPWQEWSADWFTLIDAIRDEVGGFFGDITSKPHGRMCCPIHLTNKAELGPYLDISVTPRNNLPVTEAHPKEEERMCPKCLKYSRPAVDECPWCGNPYFEKKEASSEPVNSPRQNELWSAIRHRENCEQRLRAEMDKATAEYRIVSFGQLPSWSDYEHSRYEVVRIEKLILSEHDGKQGAPPVTQTPSMEGANKQ